LLPSFGFTTGAPGTKPSKLGFMPPIISTGFTEADTVEIIIATSSRVFIYYSERNNELQEASVRSSNGTKLE
jgi:hypothetical protein